MGKDISNIIQKYVLGTSEKEELEFAISLLEDPYHNLELRPTLFKVWNEEYENNIDIPDLGDFSNLLYQIHHKIHLEEKSLKQSNIRKLVLTISKIAVVMIIGIGLGLFIQNYKKEAPVYYTSIAPKGSVSQMLLPDNTMVYLNSGSEIKYSIDGKNGNREVFLKGEAWFQVTKNKQKPFIVHTPFYNINILGTEFNVKAYPEDNEITTTLEKGSVQITSTEHFKIQSNQVLKPGEQLIYNKVNRSIEIKAVKTKFYTSWKESKLIFIDMELKDLLVLLERKYGVDIEVEDDSILELHYDGTLKNETIIEVMEILKHSLPIDYKIEDQKLNIIKN